MVVKVQFSWFPACLLAQSTETLALFCCWLRSLWKDLCDFERPQVRSCGNEPFVFLSATKSTFVGRFLFLGLKTYGSFWTLLCRSRVLPRLLILVVVRACCCPLYASAMASEAASSIEEAKKRCCFLGSRSFSVKESATIQLLFFLFLFCFVSLINGWLARLYCKFGMCRWRLLYHWHCRELPKECGGLPVGLDICRFKSEALYNSMISSSVRLASFYVLNHQSSNLQLAQVAWISAWGCLDIWVKTLDNEV